MKTDTILLPIKKKYNDLIFSRTKTIEVRRGNIPNHIKKVVIYETYPTKKIVGYFVVDVIAEEQKHDAFTSFGEKMKIESKDYLEYLEGKHNAQLIFIKKVAKFNNPVRICGSAPQAFKYITDLELELIIKEGIK